MTSKISNISFDDSMPTTTHFAWIYDGEDRSLAAASVLLLALVDDGVEIEHGSAIERSMREDRIMFWHSLGLARAILTDGTVKVELTEQGRALVDSPEVKAYVAREQAEFARGRTTPASRYRKLRDRRGCLRRKFLAERHRLAGFLAERAGVTGADFFAMARGWYLAKGDA